MSKPFTIIGAFVFLIVAGAHLYRLYAGLPIMIGSHDIPMWASYIGAGGAALLGIMLLAESRR